MALTTGIERCYAPECELGSETRTLGSLYEPVRHGNENAVDRTMNFTISKLNQYWPRFSFICVGKTKMTDNDIQVQCTLSVMTPLILCRRQYSKETSRLLFIHRQLSELCSIYRSCTMSGRISFLSLLI